MVYIATTQLCHCTVKTGIECVNKWGELHSNKTLFAKNRQLTRFAGEPILHPDNKQTGNRTLNQAMVYVVCQLPQCKYSHHGLFKTYSVMPLTWRLKSCQWYTDILCFHCSNSIATNDLKNNECSEMTGRSEIFTYF